ncbi:MAG: hypothetical protein WDZ50_05515 [Woeseia sp.]
MLAVERCAIPAGALLAAYQQGGAYADCYATDIEASVTHAEYVIAFYTTPVFKIERFILKWVAAKPSTDEEAGQLAAGTIDSFAAWQVEKRSENQLLLTDFLGNTRSWLMVAPKSGDKTIGSRLYFGSAVVPKVDAKTGERSLTFVFRALLGFHRIYSVVLLFAARSRLEKR